MKERPLEGLIEIVSEVDGGGMMGYWTRGHVDKTAFVRELEIEYGYTVDKDLVEHQYVRNVPYHGPDGPTMVCLPTDGPGRGVYTATFASIYDCDLVEPDGEPCWPGEEAT